MMALSSQAIMANCSKNALRLLSLFVFIYVLIHSSQASWARVREKILFLSTHSVRTEHSILFRACPADKIDSCPHCSQSKKRGVDFKILNLLDEKFGGALPPVEPHPTSAGHYMSFCELNARPPPVRHATSPLGSNNHYCSQHRSTFFSGADEHRHYQLFHEGVVPADRVPKFPCPHCENVYAAKSSLDSHINKKHPESAAAVVLKHCPHCSSTFKTEAGLKRHLNSKHKDKGLGDRPQRDSGPTGAAAVAIGGALGVATAAAGAAVGVGGAVVGAAVGVGAAVAGAATGLLVGAAIVAGAVANAPEVSKTVARVAKIANLMQGESETLAFTPRGRRPYKKAAKVSSDESFASASASSDDPRTDKRVKEAKKV